MTASTSSVEQPAVNEGNGDEFSWEAYFARTGAMAVETGAFYHVERSQERLAIGDSSAISASLVQTDKAAKSAADCIEIGRFVDVQDERDPRTVWPAEILENVGGRLLLKYLCLQDAGPPFWEFYLSERLHPCGVCETDLGREMELHYALPSTCTTPGFVPSTELLKEVAENTMKATLDPALFQGRSSPKQHQMEIGMWMEGVDPLGGSIFYPAMVVAVLNKYYFVIEHDSSLIGDSNLSSSNDALLRTCHSESPGLFPIGFAGQRGLSFAAPEGFDWAAYLRANVGKMAPEKCFHKWENDNRFFPGRRLEAVNPSAPHQICAATIIRRIQNLIWLHIDSSSYLTHTHVFDCRSTKLFPCGWCAAYSYPLKAPYEHNLKDFKTAQTSLAKCVQKYSTDKEFHWTTPPTAQDSAFMPDVWLPDTGCPWSPAIYISARCFTGPHIDRLRLSTKPRQVGPGPMVDVLTAVAGSVISCAYRPRDMLAELQYSSASENTMMQVAEIKAKYRIKRWRGCIEICLDDHQIPEWCRQLCIRLEACPGLIGFKPHVNDKCPFDCNRTSRVRRLGIAKPLSGVAAKRLKSRLAVQQKRLEAAEDGGQQQDANSGAAKRRRSVKTTTLRPTRPEKPKDLNVNRPVTRAAKMKRFRFGENDKSGGPASNNHSRSIRRNGSDVENGVYYHESNSESSIISGLNEVNGSGRQVCGCWSYFNDAHSPSSANIPHENGYGNGLDFYSGISHLLPSHNGTVKNGSVVSDISVTVPPVESNPALWTPEQLNHWLRSTVVGVGIADQLKEELIDGRAFLLLNIRNIQDFLELKLGPALKVCAVIKELKSIWLKKYASPRTQETKECVKCSLETCNGSHSCGFFPQCSVSDK